MFNWEEIREELGKDEYEEMQTQRESRVWLVDHADMGCGSRRTALDCAYVAGADLHGKFAEHHVSLARPMVSTNYSGDFPPEVTCGIARIETTDHKLAHYIDRKALKAAPGGLMAYIVASFYAEIALRVEKSIHRELARGDESRLLAAMEMVRHGDRMSIRQEDPLSAEKIADAASTIIKHNPHVPYPQGLACMVSPAQAMQLPASTANGRPGVHGIDTIVSPAVKFDDDRDCYEAMVAAKGSILVALSRIEIAADRVGDGTMLTVRYSSGVSIDPHQTVKVRSWKK